MVAHPFELPHISLENSEAFEEEGRVAVNVVLDNPHPNRRVSLRYFTFDYDNQAVGWRDFIPQQGRLIFERGETEKQIIIDINNDDIPEGDKTFGVKIFNPNHATIADDVAIVTIKDDLQQNLREAQPIISIANNQIILPTATNNQLEFTVSLTEASQEPITVNYNTFSLSATADEDFTHQEGSLTFAPGELTQNITVEILANQTENEIKTFGIQLSEPENAQFSPQEVSYLAVGGILNQPIRQNGIFQPIVNTTLSGRNISISDGLVQDNTIEFTVSLNRQSQIPIHVRYFTFADVDRAEYPFIPEDNLLIFQPGETAKNINISLVDNWEELAENSNITGVKLYQSKGARIMDDIGIAMREVENPDNSDVEITTLALGEEGGFDDGIIDDETAILPPTDDVEITTLALGEEGGFDDGIIDDETAILPPTDDVEITTLALGEEGGFDDGIIDDETAILPPTDDVEITTLALGEEGGFDDGIIDDIQFSTEAIGEEGGFDDGDILLDQGEVTTLAIGEEGGFDDSDLDIVPEELATNRAVGEEGGGLVSILPPVGETEISTRAMGEEGGFFNEVGDFLTNGDTDLSFL
ncbi:MAG: hypothetical protein EA365_12725 [Gloeocapsa sp. DLM2.Bin57]|nr:MAG: hypothetical protein EA365_12725 [Gloeocapsa sp. DLM2.Bin57]